MARISLPIEVASPVISMGICAEEPSFMLLRTATLGIFSSGFVEVDDGGTWRVVADGGMVVTMSKMAMAKAALELILSVGFEGDCQYTPLSWLFIRQRQCVTGTTNFHVACSSSHIDQPIHLCGINLHRKIAVD